MNKFNFEYASHEDIPEIARLLEDEEMPSHDLAENIGNFLVAKEGVFLAGVAGIEIYGNCGLLRSFCVDKSYRNLGLGGELLDRVISFAQLNNIATLYLLTLTAESYFKRRGFRLILRDSANELVKASKEFSSICPGTASCLCLDLKDRIQYHQRETLKLKEDIAGVKMWGVSLEKTQFTYFEVEPNSRFEEHSHESEQITMVMVGELFFDIEGKNYLVKEGEVFAIPSNVPHSVFTKNKKVKAVDAWSPVNKKYE